MAQVVFRRGDIRDGSAVHEVVREERITHIVHLAGLQVPFCAADPVNGSLVNVTSTLNVLEAGRRSDGQVRGITYASSIGVFGEAHMYEGGVAYDDSPTAPVQPVWGLQAGQRVDRPRLRGRLEGRLGGPASICRLRTRA